MNFCCISGLGFSFLSPFLVVLFLLARLLRSPSNTTNDERTIFILIINDDDDDARTKNNHNDASNPKQDNPTRPILKDSFTIHIDHGVLISSLLEVVDKNVVVVATSTAVLGIDRPCLCTYRTIHSNNNNNITITPTIQVNRIGVRPMA